MRPGTKVFVTDCEGPVSKNDNAFELASRFIPDGERFFALVSRYDDVLADIVHRPGYKAGDTLKLILPFLRAYGVTSSKMRVFSSENILLVPGADETLRFVSTIMPSFIVSTSYEQYIFALCDAVGFPKQNAYCTRLDIDRYGLDEEEIRKLEMLRSEISKMAMIEAPQDAKSVNDLPGESAATVRRLDEIFWEEIAGLKSGMMLEEVNPIGGYEKARAVEEITRKVDADLPDILYVGDSITDVDPFRLVRGGGGLTVSFNGNQYAIREAEIAVLSHHTVVTSIIADLFRKLDRKRVINLVENWGLPALNRVCEPVLLQQLRQLHPEKAPKVEAVTGGNMGRLMQESTAFRRTVRGEAIGRLG